MTEQGFEARIVRVSYDMARGAFEGRVDVWRGGNCFRYPCTVTAPANADRAFIDAALTARALAMSDSRLH
jgi:hypothetical protein